MYLPGVTLWIIYIPIPSVRSPKPGAFSCKLLALMKTPRMGRPVFASVTTPEMLPPRDKPAPGASGGSVGVGVRRKIGVVGRSGGLVARIGAGMAVWGGANVKTAGAVGAAVAVAATAVVRAGLIAGKGMVLAVGEIGDGTGTKGLVGGTPAWGISPSLPPPVATTTPITATITTPMPTLTIGSRPS